VGKHDIDSTFVTDIPVFNLMDSNKTKKQAPWPESASELYRRLLAKLVPIFAARGCHVVSVTDPYGRILGFLDRSRFFFFQVALQLYSTRLSGPRSRPTPQKIW
jgi:hypothetical protein